MLNMCSWQFQRQRRAMHHGVCWKAKAPLLIYVHTALMSHSYCFAET